MKTKTFVAANMAQAMEQVKKELGNEAIVISVRQVPLGPAWKVWQAPGVEVVAMQGYTAEQTNTIPNEEGTNSTISWVPEAVAPKAVKANSVAAKQKAFQVALSRSLAAEAKNNTTNPASALVDDSPPPENLISGDKLQAQRVGKTAPIAPETQGSTIKNGKRIKDLPTKQVANLQVGNLAQVSTLAQAIPITLVNAQRGLLNQGVEKEVVHKVINVCAETLNTKALENEALVREYLMRQLEVTLRVCSETALSTHRLIVLIGASGAGKTSLAAKLALRLAQLHGRKVAWICADTVRTGAIDQARVYTESLGLSLHLAYTPEEASQAIANEADGGIIIVDTPACNPYREEDLVELGALLEALPGRAAYLVAPATAKEADLAQMQAAFGVFNLAGLVITKLDETRIYGGVFNLAHRSQIPLAYFTRGTHLVEDLQPAEARALVEMLM